MTEVALLRTPSPSTPPSRTDINAGAPAVDRREWQKAIGQSIAPPRATSSQSTDAPKLQLPPSLKDDEDLARMADIVAARLAEYNKHLSRPQAAADTDLGKSLRADIAAQRDRISPETLNRLASVDMPGLRREVGRIRKEVEAMIKSGSGTELTRDCLVLQGMILTARWGQLEAETPPNSLQSRRADAVFKELGELKDLILNKL